MMKQAFTNRPDLIVSMAPGLIGVLLSLPVWIGVGIAIYLMMKGD